MAVTAGGVKVVGLTELRKACAIMGEDMPLYLREELKKLAEVVAVKARAKVPVIEGTAKGSIRTVMAGAGVAVRGGSAKAPYYGWLDFGGRIRHMGPSHAHTMNHYLFRPYIKTGRYLYPAADESAVEMAPMVEAMLDRLAVKAGWV